MSRPPKKPALALDTQLVSDNAPLMVLPKLYIGSIHSSFNLDALQDLGVTHILNCSRLPSTFPKNFIYLNIDIRDKDDSNILSCIPISNIFIEAGMSAGGVLVHCIGGRSRSAAFIAGYLMSSLGYSYDDALSLITSARQVTSINRGFEIQLRAYWKNDFDVYRAQQVLVRSRIRALHNIRGSKSSIENIQASIEINSKLAKRARRPSDGDTRIITSGSITKPINRSLLSPLTDANHESDYIVNTSNSKRIWIDGGNDEIKPGLIESPERAPILENRGDSKKSSKQYFGLSDSKPIDFIPSLSSSSSYSVSINPSFSINLSPDKNSSLPDPFQSRKNSLSQLQGKDSKHVLDSSSSQLLTLPKIVSKSPSITSNDGQTPSFNKQGSRKNSLDSNILCSPKQFAQSRSKSLSVPHTQLYNLTPLEDRSITPKPTISNNHINDIIEKPTSSYSFDTNDVIKSSPSRSIQSRPSSGRVLFNISEISSPNATSSPVKYSIPTMRIESPAKVQALSSDNPQALNMNLIDSMINDLENEGELVTPQYNGRMRSESGGGSKDTGGYTSIIREFVPLFDSKTPKIRYSKPGVSAVRVIPPLGGMDKGFCCAWCSTPLFSFANVVRVEFDVASITKSGGFDILPNNEQPRRLIHIPTSTTSKATGLFQRKNSIDMAAAMINGHKSLLKSNQTPGKHNATKVLSFQNSSELLVRDSSESTDFQSEPFISEDVEVDEFNMNIPSCIENSISKNTVTNIPSFIVPTTSRSRGAKAFNFNDSDNPTTNTTSETSSEHKNSTNSTTLLTAIDSLNSSTTPRFNSNNSGEMIADTPRKHGVDSTLPTPNSEMCTSSRSYSPNPQSAYTSGDSPRIILPPLHTPIDRRQSIEKTRWLDRVNMLRGGDDGKLSAMADADEEAQKLALSHDKYVFLEYLEWMGVECFYKEIDIGQISCFNCKKIIGSWTWTPSERQSINGKLERPVFRLHRQSVRQVASNEITPAATPRPNPSDVEMQQNLPH